MKLFSRKGYKSIKATDAKTGNIVTVPVPINGITDSKRNKMIRKLDKARIKSNREHKQKLRELKKKYPVEQRSQVNWSEETKGIL